MNCADFQRVLPDIIETGGDAEESSHLHSCAICSDLVQDLKYIAEAARMLVPMEDPSPQVWARIESSLQHEGFVRPARGTVRMEPFLISGNRRGNFYGWAGIAAMALIAITMLVFGRLHSVPAVDTGTTASTARAPEVISADDKALLNAIDQKNHSMGEVYKKKLRSADTYILDAKHSVAQNPGDAIARQQLMNAYQQKAAVYEMAVSYTTR
ncbi:MAG TPA: anti-sigma factor [Terriglobales bacterium]|jgi:hypothetical protein|nr:anti-sigma factor [Terriglobales bacterium]